MKRISKVLPQLLLTAALFVPLPRRIFPVTGMRAPVNPTRRRWCSFKIFPTPLGQKTRPSKAVKKRSRW